MKVKFTSYKTIAEDISNGIKMSKEQMKAEGKWKDDTTVEELAEFAASRVLIKVKKEGEENGRD